MRKVGTLMLGWGRVQPNNKESINALKGTFNDKTESRKHLSNYLANLHDLLALACDQFRVDDFSIYIKWEVRPNMAKVIQTLKEHLVVMLLIENNLLIHHQTSTSIISK